ncbi:Small-conductance mechanosensitive channel [compost metagenome]
MMLLQDWFMFGISLENWLHALLAAVLSYLLMDLLTRFVIRLVKRRMALLNRLTKRRVDEVIVHTLDGTKRFLLALLALLIGLNTLSLPAIVELRLSQAGIILLGLQIAIWLNRGINMWMEKLVDPEIDPELRNGATTTTMVFLLRIAVMLTVLLAVLANLGVNITAFVASLGIGGIAIAFALQAILSDLFASLSIGLDKPFEVGDFIVVDDLLGTVEYVGIRTTRLRSLSGEQLVRSNTELLKSPIRNYKRMSERRVLFNFGITHETPVDKIAELTATLRKIIEDASPTRFDRAHFVRIGPSSLEFEVVYYLLSREYSVYMDVQQHINLELMRACAERGIVFAHPTTTLHVPSEVQLSTRPNLKEVARRAPANT